VEGEKKVGKKKGLLLLFGGEKESETSLLSHFFLFQRERERERELFVRKRHRASLSRSLASERDV